MADRQELKFARVREFTYLNSTIEEKVNESQEVQAKIQIKSNCVMLRTIIRGNSFLYLQPATKTFLLRSPSLDHSCIFEQFPLAQKRLL